METIRRVSNFILFNSKGEVLIQQRTDDAPIYPSFYGMFGGKIDEGETPIAAAKRECFEELTYEMEDPKLVLHEFHDSEYGKREKYVYAEKYDEDRKLTLNEGQGMKWVGIKELSELNMIPHDKRYLLEIIKNGVLNQEL